LDTKITKKREDHEEESWCASRFFVVFVSNDSVCGVL